jgi:predicted metal-dependent HD superfamily phosphohydrolase
LLANQFWDENSFDRNVFQDLIIAYSQPHRYYHNLRHIQQVFDVVAEMRSQADNFVAIGLAVWFHDVIYNPKATDNEEKSALYARKILTQLETSPEIVKKVTKMILMTKSHQTLSKDIDTQIFLDADLSIFGSSPSDYNNYKQAIRQEYAWIAENEYRDRRKQVLSRFLQRDRIYLTEYLFKKLELNARKNIQSEIQNQLFDR